MSSTINRIGLSLLVVGFISACAQKIDDTTGIQIENDETILAPRVTYTNVDVPVTTPTLKGISSKVLSAAQAGDVIALKKIASVSSPTYNGLTLQATEVRVMGNYAYVSYNMKGDQYMGGVEVFDISTPASPKLISSLLFPDTDVHGMTVTETEVYLAGASSNASLTSPAVLKKVALKNKKLTSDITTVDIASFAATDVDIAGKYVYVTSGATPGYVTVLNKNDLSVISSTQLDDARGVDTSKSKVAVVAGTSAKLVELDKTLGSELHNWTLSGATIADSKSTVEIKDNMAFLGMGDGGTQVVCMTDGTVLASMPQPTVTGLDASLTVTNSVTAYKRTLFMSNGEAGVYMAMANSNFNKAINHTHSSGCGIDSLYEVGKLQFDEGQSVNHVVYRKDMLFVAAGTGGLKILTVSINNEDLDDDDETENCDRD